MCEEGRGRSYTVRIDTKMDYSLEDVIDAVDTELWEVYDVRDGFITDRCPTYFRPATLPNIEDQVMLYEKTYHFLTEARDKNSYYTDHIEKIVGYQDYEWRRNPIIEKSCVITAKLNDVKPWFITDNPYRHDESYDEITEFYDNGVTIEMIGAAIESACKHYLYGYTIVTTKRG